MLSPTSSLQVSDQWTDILDTPLNVEVMPRRAGQTFTDLSDPRGLAITRELVLLNRKEDFHLRSPRCGRMEQTLHHRIN